MESDDVKENFEEESAYLDEQGQKYPRPLDYLNYFKNKKVSVSTRHKGQVVGILHAFDLSINLGIIVEGRHEFIKGEDVLLISSGEVQEIEKA